MTPDNGHKFPTFVCRRRKFYPPSFRQNSTKEKLLLWYAENFRRQYYFTYKDRKPLFLAADNECGIQVKHFTGQQVASFLFTKLF